MLGSSNNCCIATLTVGKNYVNFVVVFIRSRFVFHRRIHQDALNQLPILNWAWNITFPTTLNRPRKANFGLLKTVYTQWWLQAKCAKTCLSGNSSSNNIIGDPFESRSQLTLKKLTELKRLKQKFWSVGEWTLSIFSDNDHEVHF